MYPIGDPVDIWVAGASAEASTELAAFDACLLKIGIGNFNLLYLSSVIPPSAKVLRASATFSNVKWGDRLYCVIAQSRTSVAGMEVWAGLGWVREASTGRGLFAEATGPSEADVRFELSTTLSEMTSARDGDWSSVEIEVAGSVCKDRPTCALVVASYHVEGWT